MTTLDLHSEPIQRLKAVSYFAKENPTLKINLVLSEH